MNDKYYIGKRAKSVTIGAKLPPVSKIRLTGENDIVYEAGDDSGYIMEIYVPTATQTMANTILQQAKGFEYQGFVANNAFLPPTVELGDGITTHGVYGILASQEFSFTPKMTEEVSAPYESEVDHEYSYTGTYDRAIANRVQIGKLYYGTRISRKNGLEIIKTDGSIEKSRVTLNSDLLAFYNDNGQQVFYFDPIKGTFVLNHYANIEDALDGSQAFSSLEFDTKQLQIKIGDAEGNISSLQQTASSLQSQITSAEGDISSIEQKVNSLTLSVSNGYDTSTVTLKAGNISLGSATIDMNGLVTFSGLSGGTTTIDGACIKTGQIDADRLNLTGSITFRDLSASVQEDINGAYDAAQDAFDLADSVDSTISGWVYPGTTEIDGASIRTGTVSASILRGGQIELLDGRGYSAGYMSLSGAETAIYAVDITSYAALRLLASSGDLFLRSGHNTHIDIGPQIGMNCDLDVVGDVTSNGVILTSDLTKKKDVSYDISMYDKLFDTLKPISYLFTDGSSGRRHLGLGAQDVEDALSNVNISTQEFASLVKFESGEYALRYIELIPLLIDQVQRLKLRVRNLEKEG